MSFDPERNIANTHLVGQAEATHLGNFTVTADVAVYVTTPTGIALGSWIFIAANGEKLFSTMAGGGGAEPLQGVGHFIIVGGTGRFQGATGSYQQIITFTADPATSPLSITLCAL